MHNVYCRKRTASRSIDYIVCTLNSMAHKLVVYGTFTYSHIHGFSCCLLSICSSSINNLKRYTRQS